MAKHAVPKKKQSTSRSNRRYRTFENLARIKLQRMTNLTRCEKCGATVIRHQLCKECGTYRGKDILGKMVKAEAKVTTIKTE